MHARQARGGDEQPRLEHCGGAEASARRRRWPRRRLRRCHHGCCCRCCCCCCSSWARAAPPPPPRCRAGPRSPGLATGTPRGTGPGRWRPWGAPPPRGHGKHRAQRGHVLARHVRGGGEAPRPEQMEFAAGGRGAAPPRDFAEVLSHGRQDHRIQKPRTPLPLKGLDELGGEGNVALTGPAHSSDRVHDGRTGRHTPQTKRARRSPGPGT